MTQAILSVKGLTKRYGGVAAIDNVSFDIQRGEVVGFVGLNGAGKSTTIDIIQGFLRPTEGSVALFGEPVHPENAHVSHQKIGFSTGDMNIFTNLTGGQYLKFVERAYGTKDSTAYRGLCATFEPQLDKKIGDMSRGNKQKIALIAAFMSEPELVILDEPSSGLDPLMQQHFVDLIREQAAKGTTVFMSSHYLNEVVDVCSRVLLIKKGVIVKDVPAEALVDAAGKMVRVVTKRKVTPPKAAELVQHESKEGEHVLSFVYKGKPLRLQEWLGTLPNLTDITIADHNAEATFDELYDVKEVENV